MELVVVLKDLVVKREALVGISKTLVGKTVSLVVKGHFIQQITLKKLPK